MKLQTKLLLTLFLVGLPLIAVNAWWVGTQQGRQRERVQGRLYQEAVQTSSIVRVILTDLADRGQQVALHMPERADWGSYLTERLAYLRFWNMGITGLAWADADGILLAGEPPTLFQLGTRFGDRRSLDALKNGKTWALDELVVEADQERAVATLRMLARAPGSSFRGVVGIVLRPEFFRPLFPAESSWAQIRLADRSGRLVYATDQLDPTLDERFDWVNMPGLRDALKRGVPTDQVGPLPGDPEGGKWMAAHVPISEVGWVTTVMIREADALHESRRTLYGELAIQSALVLLCAGAALILARRVAMPARRLADAARRIAAGDRTARAGIQGRDELAVVGGAFDEMAEALDSSWESLQSERDAAEGIAARLATLSRLASLVGSSLDPAQVFDFIAESTSYLLDGAVVLLLVSDAEGGPVTLRAAHAVRHPELRRKNQYQPGEGLIGWVLQHREPLILSDMLADGRALNRSWIEAEGVRAFAGVPLMQLDRCMGVLYAARGGERPFAGQDVDLLKSIAAHAATAIQNAYLYKLAEVETERLRAVLESMPAAVVVGEGRPEDRTVRFILANRAFKELQEGEGLIPGAATPSYQLLRPDGSPLTDDELPLQRAIWNGEATKEKEIVLQFADGRQRWLVINAVAFAEVDGCRRAVSMILDVTEHRKAEKELKRLAAENAALFEQAAREAKEKGLLLDELHHRVRNNLAMIISFLELQRSTPAGRQAETVIDEAVSRVKGLALIHDVLGGTGFHAGQYDALVHRLANHTFLQGPLAGRVELRVKKQPLSLPSRELTALGIITNELFTNIAKHAFSDGRAGVVEVVVELDGPEIMIRISDNGVGLLRGFDKRRMRLGLGLVRSLAEVSLQGSFSLEGGNGTTAIIRFPIPVDGGSIL